MTCININTQLSLLQYMTYEKFKTQQETKNRNETAILKALSEKPMRFKDLIDTTGLSKMGLTAILKRLQSEDKIEKTIYENHEAYALTIKGQDYLQKMWMILYEIDKMQSIGADYDSNYFTKSSLNWSLITEIGSPDFNYYPLDYRNLTTKIYNEYLKFLLLNIKDKYLVKNEDQSYSISEPEKIRGRHIIAFEIDFDLMREYIEYTLEPNIKDDKPKIGKYTSISDEIKDHIKKQYRDILFNEETKTILHSESDIEDKDKEDDQQ